MHAAGPYQELSLPVLIDIPRLLSQPQILGNAILEPIVDSRETLDHFFSILLEGISSFALVLFAQAYEFA